MRQSEDRALNIMHLMACPHEREEFSDLHAVYWTFTEVGVNVLVDDGGLEAIMFDVQPDGVGVSDTGLPLTCDPEAAVCRLGTPRRARRTAPGSALPSTTASCIGDSVGGVAAASACCVPNASTWRTLLRTGHGLCSTTSTT